MYNYKYKRLGLLLLFCGLFLGVACSDYLDAKPDSSLAVLITVQDYQAVMDNETRYNNNYPFAGDYACDYFYLSDADFQSLDESGRNGYLWKAEPPHDNNWEQNYGRIYDANVVLDGIDKAELSGMTEEDRHRVKGAAFFARGLTFYHLAQLFAPPFRQGESNGVLGIPLRISSDINVSTRRASLDETYNLILDDLKRAANLLPERVEPRTRPSKAAAYAALSRVCLTMQDYEGANQYADSCLNIYASLIDYNDLDTASNISQFPALNDETLFYAVRGDFSWMVQNAKARVDSVLYTAYEENDLRKKLFFRKNEGGVLGFYGDYSGNTTLSCFFGLATDEVYLTSAECKARLGDADGALEALNRLLINRYKREFFQPIVIRDASELLRYTLKEREKELAFRSGIRWADLRRLNLDARFAKRLVRQIGGKETVLEPNSERYTFKIPYDIIQLTRIEQNP